MPSCGHTPDHFQREDFVNDELKKEAQDGPELTNGELENVTGGSISLNFSKIEIVYTQQKSEGSTGENQSSK
jgi:type VI protein secretion system component Hcp